MKNQVRGPGPGYCFMFGFTLQGIRGLVCLAPHSSFLLSPSPHLHPPLPPLPPPLCAENQTQGLPMLGEHSTLSWILGANGSYPRAAAQLQVSPLSGPDPSG